MGALPVVSAEARLDAVSRSGKDRKASHQTSQRTSHQISPRDLHRTFQRNILGWYDEHRRDLPWRETRDPYRIWLSEIMLQQTRVAAVLEHYRIFVERFPDVNGLASASLDAVLAAWSGLGYYRRARMLHECAKEIVGNYGGRFPRSAVELQTLPGIGRYTAAAIASIAFDEAAAVVDGNVERVLRRFVGADLTAAQTWEYAQAFLAGSRPGDFNQAMMELGAMVCVPREPRCLMCPVKKGCVTQGDVPRAERAPRQKKEQIWCALDWRSGKGDKSSDLSRGVFGRKTGEIRLVRRSTKASLMAGMWELPQWLERPAGLADAAHWRTFRHSITVTDYTVHVLRNARSVDAAFSNTLSGVRGKWVAVERIAEIPITGLTRKILKAGGII
jgi:A/G-specific adenine glycosylase